jgi:hypothetical protein
MEFRQMKSKGKIVVLDKHEALGEEPDKSVVDSLHLWILVTRFSVGSCRKVLED